MQCSCCLLRLCLAAALCGGGLGRRAFRGGRQADIANGMGSSDNVSAQNFASWNWMLDLKEHESGQNSTEDQLLSTDSGQGPGPQPRIARPPTPQDKPRVYFLFLTRVGLDHTRHWQAFFEGADPNSYRGFIHCAEEIACQLALGSHNTLGLTQIETVPTIYCEDLMSAMVALLINALREAPGRRSAWRDKFVFASESTLPVKPFSHIYSAFTQHAKSDFCFGDVADWPALFTGYGTGTNQVASLVKHSQWSVLSREHAGITAQNWPEIMSHKSYNWNIPVMGPGGKVLRTAQLRDHICTDEWATFASIYGGVTSPHFIGIEGLSTGQWLPAKTGWHGACQTFTYWHMSDANAEVRDLATSMLADHQNTLSCNKTALSSASPDCLSSHPMAIEDLSWRSARLFRKSSFLFARKFAPNAVSLERFKNILLSP